MQMSRYTVGEHLSLQSILFVHFGCDGESIPSLAKRADKRNEIRRRRTFDVDERVEDVMRTEEDVSTWTLSCGV